MKETEIQDKQSSMEYLHGQRTGSLVAGSNGLLTNQDVYIPISAFIAARREKGLTIMSLYGSHRVTLTLDRGGVIQAAFSLDKKGTIRLDPNDDYVLSLRPDHGGKDFRLVTGGRWFIVPTVGVKHMMQAVFQTAEDLTNY